VSARDKLSLYQKKGKRASGHYKHPPVRNGPVPSTVQLACAIRYFAGGSPYNNGCIYGVSYQSVLESVWVIVEAINMTPEFYIFHSESLEAQRKIAAGFKKSNTPKINNCAGTIDGILIWTAKPSLMNSKSSGIDQNKYLCGHKHKFGLNCQAVSDSQVVFLLFQLSMEGLLQIAWHLGGVTYINGSTRD